jgi:hypothetical protein
MALCFASVASCTETVGPGSAGSSLMLTYDGMGMESSPRGPVMCTVDMACTRDALARADGALTVNVTFGGMESGAEPILDWHGEVVAKPLQAAAGV